MNAPETASVKLNWGVREIALGVAIYVVAFVALASLTRLARNFQLDGPATLRPLLNSLSFLLLEALLLLPVGLCAVWRVGGSWARVGFRRVSFRMGCLLPLASLWLAFAISAAWGSVIYLMGWPRQPALAPLLGNDPLAIAVGFVAACLVAPLAEETFFRGFLLGGLRARFGPGGALILSALCFALLHLPLSIFPAIFGLGLLLGGLFLRSGSLWPGILLHALFNTLGFVAQFAATGRF